MDRDTLIRRWYVHRIRLDSDGTAPKVSIGTEASARDTEWSTLDETRLAALLPDLSLLVQDKGEHRYDVACTGGEDGGGLLLSVAPSSLSVR
ncbi:hypothetical protein [Streptomyces sp. NPDC126522]|uniref:hypothetical protein n=1 Tax=Streptomyces sp. NPDC126522 TaxID=3155211 RepID=UPI00331C0AF6